MPYNEGMISTGDGLWNTPLEFYERLNAEFKFDFDPCPVSPTEDGLLCDWGQRNFCNPPFQNANAWIDKILEEQRKKKLIVLLIPARTDTSYFHDKILPHAKEIRFIRGRLRYISQGGIKEGVSPFPSMIVVF